MANIVNTLGWNTYLHMLLFLKFANRDPGGHLAECTYGADASKDDSHEAADKAAVLPAGCLEGRPEVATQATLTRLAVVQEKTVGASHSIVVEVVNNRHLEIKGGLIDGGGEGRKDIVNLPKIKVTNFLIFTDPLGDGQIVKSVKGGTDFGLNIGAQKFLGRTDKIFDIVLLLEGVANSKYGTFLTTKMNIAAENLENTEPPHPLILFSGGRPGKLQGRRVGVAIFPRSG